MANDKSEEKAVFAIIPAQGDEPATLIFGISKAGWAYMQGGMAHDFDLSDAGLPLKIVIFGSETRADALNTIKLGAQIDNVQLQDRQNQDFSIRDLPRQGDPPPVDRSQRVHPDGSPVDPDHREIIQEGPHKGQQKRYVVLSDEERAKGFVRPVRRTYVHENCGVATTMGLAIAETYARDPGFYSGTFCVGCGAHFPVGEDGEFVWDDGSKVGT